jgi:hypothetical protein
MKISTLILLSLGLLLLFGKGCAPASPGAMMQWKFIGKLFWFLWIIEVLFMLWWLLDDMKSQYLRINPMVYLGWVWVIAAGLLYLAQVRWLALLLVGIAALPLAIMALYLLVILIASMSGPIRWN